MTDSRQRKARAKFAIDQMSAERPLDALLPSLGQPAPPKTAVHPRVLETRTEQGQEWVLLLWDDPGGPHALHSQLKALVEATVLAELSRTPARVRDDGERSFVGIQLFSWAKLTWDPTEAMGAFGFAPASVEMDEGASAAIKAEAERSGRTIGAPQSGWRAEIRHHEGGLGDKLRDVASMMAERMGSDVWGRNPGGPSHLFATYVAKTFGEKVRPDLDGLRSLDLLLVQQEPNVIRWIPPLVFQALCDFIPVAAATIYQTKVGWAESEDLGDGFAHPPLIRIAADGGETHIPIGHHVLRWWMMPLRAGEDVPTIADWVSDQFGA